MVGPKPRLAAMGVDCFDLHTAEASFNVQRNAYMRPHCRQTSQYYPTTDPVTLYLADQYLLVDDFRQELDSNLDGSQLPDGVAGLSSVQQSRAAAAFTSLMIDTMQKKDAIDAALADPSFVERLTTVLLDQKGLHSKLWRRQTVGNGHINCKSL